ncbi:MAG: AraC family transcriptional regulator [Prevotella sp.]|jgi:AraC-like DNA-binding protein|nr:AraC family transcriptional regulator [Prevotella sp.]
MHGKPDLILLNVGHSELNADWNWKEIYSPFARIYYVESGEARTRIGGEIYSLQPGHLYLTPPFTLHDDECDSYFSLYYIHFFEKALYKESIFDIYEFPIEIKAGVLDSFLTERLLYINPDRHLRHYDPKLYDNPPTFSQYIADNNRMPMYYSIETQGILYQLLSKFLETATVKTSNRDIRISKSLQYIHENIDKDISVSNLSDIACLSEDHLIRLFRNEMGYTPLKYVNLKKIEKAQLLLLTTDTSIREIAFELSIDNISYFNRIFKQYTGKTPGEYRSEYNR